MTSAVDLKQRLRETAQAGDSASPASERAGLVPAMMAHIGSTDSELRDDLIYSSFASWISEDQLPVDLLHGLVDTGLDDQHLFFGLGECGTDSVFTRSFSMLLVPLLLDAHLRRPYLEPREIQRLEQAVLRCVQFEKDRRGFVEGKGWAHTAAHTADALEQLALCPDLDATHLQALLAAIRALAACPDIVYTHDEEERLGIAALGVLRRQALTAADWEDWIGAFVTIVEQTGQTAVGSHALPANYHQRINCKHFLRGLYFRLRKPENAGWIEPGLQAALLTAIERALGKITRF